MKNLQDLLKKHVKNCDFYEEFYYNNRKGLNIQGCLVFWTFKLTAILDWLEYFTDTYNYSGDFLYEICKRISLRPTIEEIIRKN